MSRRRHEREVAGLALRAAAAASDAEAARLERDITHEALVASAPKLRQERDEAIARARTYADRNLRQAKRLERLQHDLAMARDGGVDATTWGCPPATEDAG